MNGHDDSWRRIAPAIAQALEKARCAGRIGQAYLLVGDRRDQLECFAGGMARTASCITPNPDGGACGHCRNCRLWADDAYTEMCRVEPESKSRIIKIEAMREFDRQMWLSVPSSMIKFGVVADADRMGEDAQNTFLKTLEEPPERTMMILLTTSPQLLLPTIRSRCQTVLLKNNRVDYSREVPAEALALLASMHRGAGTRVAFNSSSRLKAVLAELQSKAEETVEAGWDDGWSQIARGDAKMAKQLEDMKKVKIQTEYLRLRMAVMECVQAWFQQRSLVAAGVGAGRLPQAEFVPLMGAALANPPSVEEAEADNRAVNTMLRALRANVPESLCLDAFCLSICEKA